MKNQDDSILGCQTLRCKANYIFEIMTRLTNSLRYAKITEERIGNALVCSQELFLIENQCVTIKFVKSRYLI